MNFNNLRELDGKDCLAISAEEGAILNELVKKHRPNIVVEVGTGHGYSTAWLQSGLEKGAHIITFDVERRRLIDFPTWEKTIFVKGELDGSSLPSPVDFAFLDSDHQIHTVVKDIETLVPLLSKEAVIIVHDTIFRDLMGKGLRDYFTGVHSDLLKTIPLEPSRLKWDYEEKKTQYGLGIAVRSRGQIQGGKGK